MLSKEDAFTTELISEPLKEMEVAPGCQESKKISARKWSVSSTR